MQRYALVAALTLMSACNEEPKATALATTSASAKAASSAAPARAATMVVTSKVPAAIEAYERGLELAVNAHEAEAIEQFRKAIAADPKLALAHAYLGYYTPESEGTKELELAQSLAAQLPEPEWLLVQELAAVRNGNLTEARLLAERRVFLVPFDWHAQFDLASRLYTENRLEEAAERLRKAAAFGPASYPVYNMLGYVQLKQRKFDAAVATFRRYNELKPDEPNALDSLGEALLNAGKLEESEKAFTKAAGMQFSYSWSGVAQTRFLRGDIAGGLDALAKSRAAAQRPVDKLDVDTIGVWATLATPEAKKRIDDLEKEAQAEKLDEHYALTSLYRAVARLDAGAPEDALREIEEAMRRVEGAAVPGAAMNRVRRPALAWRAIAQARLKRGADAAETAAALAADAKKAPTDPDAQSMASFGRGMAALAKGDAADAVKELSTCLEDDFLCRWQLAVAEDKQGDKAAAATTRAKLTGGNLRDAAYVYVHAKIAGAAADAGK